MKCSFLSGNQLSIAIRLDNYLIGFMSIILGLVLMEIMIEFEGVFL